MSVLESRVALGHPGLVVLFVDAIRATLVLRKSDPLEHDRE